jgi:hypothetical protein
MGNQFFFGRILRMVFHSILLGPTYFSLRGMIMTLYAAFMMDDLADLFSLPLCVEALAKF